LGTQEGIATAVAAPIDTVVHNEHITLSVMKTAIDLRTNATYA
jgi:hypothetical protein